MSEERTLEDVENELEVLKKDVAEGKRPLDQDAQSEAMNLCIEIFFKKGLIEIPLPGIAGTFKAFEGFIKTLLGDKIVEKLIALGEKGTEVISNLIMKLTAKVMYFIMMVISFATGGLVPAPPNLEVVLFYMAFLKSIAELQKQLSEEEEETPEVSSNSSSGNIV
jgi:hypothetical protein